jgi:hypothetical protein
MSKKYIAQIDNDNFVFPNNRLAEYDVEIIHDLKEDSVNGVITGFSPLTYSGSPSNIGISFTYQWYLNNAEPFISPTNGKLNILSVHMQSPTKAYFKPWICVGAVQDNNVNLTYKTDIYTIWVTPQMMGQTTFSSGTYYFEVRFLGKRAVFPVSTSKTLTLPTPTPTPGPTVTPGGPTPTPTPTATPSNPCYCYEIVVTGTTGGEGGTIAVLDYNDCYSVRTSRAFTVGPGTYKQCIQTVGGVVQYFEGTYGIDQSYLTIPGIGNCRTGYVCTGYTPATTATPTPTPTTTGVPPTNTPTPTPTGVPPTNTPTPTPTGVPPTYTPTPTPTATPTATPVLNNIIMYSGSSAGAACSNPTPATYHYYGSFGIGTTLILPDLSDNVPNGNYFYGDTNLVYLVTLGDGRITSTASCPTPTPTPTPLPTTFTAYISDNDGDSACANILGYGTFTYNGYGGTGLCGCTSISGYTADIAPGGEFWLATGGQVRQFQRSGSSVTSYPMGACTTCPTATPTPTPTATALPPTYTPTPTPTTTPLPPTSTPTPTPSPVSIGIYTGATFGSASAACTDGTSMSGAIFIPSGTLLNNGDTVYSNSLCTTPFSGNNQYYRLFYFGNFYSAQISSGGIVSGFVACSSLPTPTPTATPSPTATPTPTSTGNYYNATRYICPAGTGGATAVICYSPSSLTNGRYYNIGDGYAYKINSGTSGPSYDVDLTGACNSATGSGACSC